MNIFPREELIVRESFLLPFRGGEIWALELDALSIYTELAIEKFRRDIKFAWRPSTTSRVAIHLKDTQLNAGFINAVAEGVAGGKEYIQKVAFIGVGPEHRNALLAALQSRTIGIAFKFFDDYEKAKEWLLP